MNAPVPRLPLVEVKDLSVTFGKDQRRAVEGVSFVLERGECLALVGESGSGKSVTARTLVGLSGYSARVNAQRLAFGGQNLQEFDEQAWRRVRGHRVGFIPQDALGSLDPLRTVGAEVSEVLELHTRLGREQRRAKVVELLRAVGIPDPEIRAAQHPRELSGGLRQRALIASAIACGPELLIADEPTTALDASIQAQILELLESLRSKDNAMLVISHDLAVISRLADSIAVMRQGRIIEYGPAERVLREPQHPYTQSLLAAANSVHSAVVPSEPPVSVPASGPILLEAEELAKSFSRPDGKKQRAVSGVSLQLRAGETVGIVGESGSGKTTLLRLILGLESPDSGKLKLRGKDWAQLSGAERRAERRRIQVVFQDPLGSFDPRYTVARVIGEALDVRGLRFGQARRLRMLELLNMVKLDPSALLRRPIELSGGQRQRVAIARALAMEPEILVCDEPVSALDVSVQARILELLESLKERLNLSCLFISHDLGIIRRISDRVLVMQNGNNVESGSASDVFENPRHPYTVKLLRAIPSLPGGPRPVHA
jgi:peptide/nickel transport system ATP-binding protein